ncbi:hypothetical protein MRN67_14465 [bacterium 19CA01SA08]|uniref:Phenylacetate--CoA ligase family protein n=1 Tax=bacterium 19CA01SA08 TaxID=2920574 RepID=A0AAU6VPR9_UNCXX
MVHRIYLALPYFLQNVLLTFFAFFNDKRRYGGRYRHIEEEVFNRGKFSPKELKAYQIKKLKEALEHAQNSKYWAKRFNEFGVDPSSENPISELLKLPILTKHEVRNCASQIRIDTNNSIKVHTSGTTGAGLIFYETQQSEAERWATWWRYRNDLGIYRGDWCVLFGGRSIIAPDYKGKNFHRVNYYSKQVLFSCYHLSNENIKFYIQELNSRKIEWIHGYPSVISELAHLALENNYRLDYKVKSITLGAESLSANQARVIESFFGVRPKQHYGLAESVANLSQKSNDAQLHVDEDFAYVEFIPVDGSEGLSRIVGTNFTNKSFPLFRYDTGDLASGLNENTFPRVVRDIDGRKEDYVLLPNGSKVGRLDHIFKDAVYVDEAQIVQLEDFSLEVKLVVNQAWDDDIHFPELEGEFRERLGRDIKIVLNKVESIERTKSGKLRFVISKVKK